MIFVVCTHRYRWLNKFIVLTLLLIMAFIVRILHHHEQRETDYDVIIKSNPKKQLPLSIQSTYPSTYDMEVKGDRNIADIISERKHNLQEACKELNMTRTPSLDYLKQARSRNIFVLPKLKLIYCAVPKVATTSWKRFFLAVDGHHEFMNKSHIFPHTFFNHVNQRVQRIFNTTNSAERALDEYRSFLFVRNPYTRILSAFQDKLQWSPNNATEQLQSDVKNWIRFNEPELANRSTTGAISFEAFVVHYLEARSKNEHWEDMYKLCHPCMIDYDFIGHYETLESDSGYLKDNMIQSDILLPGSRVSRKPTDSSNERILANFYSQLPKHLMESLKQSEGIQRDCKLFGYSLPESIRHL